MAAYISICAINGKGKASQTPLNAARHNLREIAAELTGAPGSRIDASRSARNLILAGPATGLQVEALMHRLIDSFGAIQKRKDNIKMFEVVVSVKEPVKDLDVFFEQARLWMVSHYDCPLASAVVHYDEADPHMHLLFVAVRNGKLDGHNIMGNRAALRRLQSEFQEQVGAKHGIRATPRYSQLQRGALARRVLQELTAAPWRMKEANAGFVLKKCVSHYVMDWAEALGLELQDSPTAIAVEVREKEGARLETALSLCSETEGAREATATLCVAVALPDSEQDAFIECTKLRDSEQEARFWDCELGEYRPPATTCGKTRQAAKAEVVRSMPVTWTEPGKPFHQLRTEHRN